MGVKNKGDIDHMSEEKVTAMREVLKNDRERVKEEKRRIIEDTKTERPVRRKRPFDVIDSVAGLPKRTAKIRQLEPHQALLAERPFLVLFILILLSVICYGIYKHAHQKMNSPH